jgi:uncharacterized membrane protein YhaH (DUF805 family)
MSSTNLPRRRREFVFAALFWLGALGILVLTTSLVGLVKRGLPLEGWTGTSAEQVVGWMLLTAPYVFVVWLPVALCAIGVTRLFDLSRRSWLALALVLALAMLVLFGATA